jgi:hypothetical protein
MHDRIVCQATFPSFQQHTDGQRGDAQVAGHGGHDGQGPMLVANVILDDHAGMEAVISRPVAGAESSQ